MKKLMSALLVVAAVLAVAVSPAQAARSLGRGGAKYVFYFIGDGMASPQIHATEAYLAALSEDDAVAGGVKAELLHMSTMPVQGMQMSFANNRFITGSAAAGTALACGMKTNINVISMDPDATMSYNTLAEKAKEKGMKVGIVSSVSIDHATPAVFYAHTATRKNMHDIDMQLANSDFDYFGGGGLVSPVLTDPNGIVLEDAIATAAENGFQYIDTRAGFDAVNSGRVIAVNPHLDGSKALPYALNRMYNPTQYPDSITLAEFTQKGIDLMDGNEGFFMMVEGGKIDWACHANDAKAAIQDTIAFDDAVKVALDFAEAHPRDTLIVVTGDHECGGMTLGFAGTGYETYYEQMEVQKVAYDDFANIVLAGYAADIESDPNGSLPADIDDAMWALIYENFGMDANDITVDTGDDLTDFEVELLEDAYDLTFNGYPKDPRGRNIQTQEESLLYGYYDPLTVTLTHLQNRKTGLAWTSYSHTAVPVPVLAQGKDAWRFDGYYDNTDVAKKIAQAMKVDLGN